jgi:hypothetical protein
MRKPNLLDVKLDRLSVMFFYYLKLYPNFRSFTLKDLQIKIQYYRPAKDIDIETRIDLWEVTNAIELEKSTNDAGETEYKILKIDPTLENIDIYFEIEEEVSKENALRWIQEVKAKVFERKAALESAFDGVLLKLSESERVDELKKRKENFVKWYENSLNPLRYYNVENPSDLAKKLSTDSKYKRKIPVSFSNYYLGKFETEKLFKDACEDRFNELLPIEVLVEKINELESQNPQKQVKQKLNYYRCFNHSLNLAQITALYHALKGKYILLEMTFDEFQAPFNSNLKESAPIVWIAGKGDLVYLFETLQLKGKIGMADTIQAKLQRWFINTNGDPMNNLKQAKQNYLKNVNMLPENGIEILSIISSLL